MTVPGTQTGAIGVFPGPYCQPVSNRDRIAVLRV
jgi:hypothetical protein